MGHKWSIRALLRHLEEKGVDTARLWSSIHDVVVKTLVAAEPTVTSAVNASMRHRGLCFELFGFDILIDAKLKAWLIEVNVCPSLASSAPLDRQIKTSLLTDVFHLVGFVPYSARRAARELRHVKQARLLGVAAARSAQGGTTAGAESSATTHARGSSSRRGARPEPTHTAASPGSVRQGSGRGPRERSRDAAGCSGDDEDQSSSGEARSQGGQSAAPDSAAAGRLPSLPAGGSADGEDGGGGGNTGTGAGDEESHVSGLEAGSVSELDLEAGGDEEAEGHGIDAAADAPGPATWEEIPVDYEPEDPFSVTPSRAAAGRRGFSTDSGDSAPSEGAGSEEEGEEGVSGGEEEGERVGGETPATTEAAASSAAAGAAWWPGDEAIRGAPCGEPPPVAVAHDAASGASAVRTVRRLRAERRSTGRRQRGGRSGATSALNTFGLPAAQSPFVHQPLRRHRQGAGDTLATPGAPKAVKGATGAGGESHTDGASLTDGLELLPGSDAVQRMHAHRRIRRGLLSSQATPGTEPPPPLPPQLSPLQVVPSFTVESVEGAGVEQWGVAELEVVAEMEEEYVRQGNFSLAFPGPDSDRLLPLFDRPRYNNTLCHLWLRHKRDTGATLHDLAALLARAARRAAAEQEPVARPRRARSERGRAQAARRGRSADGRPPSRASRRRGRKDGRGAAQEGQHRPRLPPRPQRAASASRAQHAPSIAAGATATDPALAPAPGERGGRPSRGSEEAGTAPRAFAPLGSALQQSLVRAPKAGAHPAREPARRQAPQHLGAVRRATSAPRKAAARPAGHVPVAGAAAGAALRVGLPGWPVGRPPHGLVGSFPQGDPAHERRPPPEQPPQDRPVPSAAQRDGTDRAPVGGVPTPASLLREHFQRGSTQRAPWRSDAREGIERPGSAQGAVPWVRRAAVATGFSGGGWVSPVTSGSVDVEPAPRLSSRGPRTAAPRGRRPKSAVRLDQHSVTKAVATDGGTE